MPAAQNRTPATSRAEVKASSRSDGRTRTSAINATTYDSAPNAATPMRIGHGLPSDIAIPGMLTPAMFIPGIAIASARGWSPKRPSR